MAVYAIGDIQGCYDELQLLLDKIQYSPSDDQLWFTGDLVNRGPKSLKTLRFISQLPNVHVSLGNHDLHLIAVAFGTQTAKKKDTISKILKADDSDELIHWLRQRKIMHRDKSLGYCMVHAGIHPKWKVRHAQEYAHEIESVLQGDDKQLRHFLKHMYGNKPNQWNDDLEGVERLRFITNVFTRMRYCSRNGKLNFSQKNNPGQTVGSRYVPWFDIINRPSIKHKIIIGHWSTLGLVHRKNIYAIDTGCLWGGQLTALRIDCEIPEIHQVNAINGISPY